jgi:archaellum component FlaC
VNPRDQLASYVKKLRARLRLGAVLRGAALVISAALTATVVLVLISNALAFSDGSVRWSRLALFLVLAGAAGFGLAAPLLALSNTQAVRRAEGVFPQFDQRLLTFTERDQGNRDPFIELLAADTLDVARAAQPAYLVPDGKLMAWTATSVASFAVLIWLIAAGPGFLGYGAARLWAGSLRSVAPFYDIRVSPGNAAVRRSANQLITAQVIGRQADSARLYARYQSASKWEQVAMQRQPGASGFEFLFAGLPESVEYYIEAGSLRSRHYNLRVTNLPAVKQIRVTYHFPAWTGQRDATEDHGGDLRAVEGTEAELNVSFDQPVPQTFLALDDGKQIDLSAREQNVYHGAVRIEKDGLYHVAGIDQGQPVRLSEDFFIEARKASPPDVRVTRPGRDYHSSPIEEVTVGVRAADDFGLSNVDLHYSVNGGPDQTVNLLKQKGVKELDGTTTLSLEDFHLVPGDVVGLYASAKDAHSEARTDIFFIQAEPFEREYTQSQVMGGGMGGEQAQISQREKEIIAETWKHQGDKNPSKQQATEAAKFLSGVQAKLRDQSLSLAGRLERRELTEENAEFSHFQEDMNAAAKAMDPAAQNLAQQKWKEAIPEEQKALQYLLRAEATFRQIEVAFGSRGGGGGGGGGSGRDLQSLFDLELDTEKNQYETEQTAGGSNERAQQIDSALQKLDELARRQQELAEQQQRNPKGFQSRWEQEMLRREAEKLQEQMEQMARDSSQQGQSSSSNSSSSSKSSGNSSSQSGQQSSAQASVQQALERLRQANDDMRRAGSPEQSQADARRAADRLREASNLLGRMRNQDAAQRLDSMAREGDRLAGEQRAQEERMRRAAEASAKGAGQGQGDAAGQEMSRLADDRQRMASDLAALEKEMQNATRDLAAGQNPAAGKLRDALSGIEQSQLPSRAQHSAEMLRRGMNATPGEAAIKAGLDRLDEQLRQAQQVGAGQQRNPEEALDRVESLRSQVEALARGLGGRNPQAGLTREGNPQAGQGREGNPQAGQGREGNAQAGLSREGNAQSGEGRPGDPQAGHLRESLSDASGFRGANAGGPRRTGDYVGGYDPGGFSWPQGRETQQVPTTQADIERAYQDALRDLNELRNTVRGQPGQLGDINDLLRELNHLDPRRFPGNPAMLDELHAQVLASVDKIELRLRRDLDEKQTGQVRSGDTLHVPDGYQDSVAEYFRRLSKRPEASK